MFARCIHLSTFRARQDFARRAREGDRVGQKYTAHALQNESNAETTGALFTFAHHHKKGLNPVPSSETVLTTYLWRCIQFLHENKQKPGGFPGAKTRHGVVIAEAPPRLAQGSGGRFSEGSPVDHGHGLGRGDVEPGNPVLVARDGNEALLNDLLSPGWSVAAADGEIMACRNPKQNARTQSSHGTLHRSVLPRKLFLHTLRSDLHGRN